MLMFKKNSLFFIILLLITFILTPIILGINVKFFVVLSGSMEPYFSRGDIIAVKSIDPQEIKISDIITFKDNLNNTVTHRVTDIITKENSIFFKTKGDANYFADLNLTNSNSVLGKVKYIIPYIGYLCIFIRDKVIMSILLVQLFIIFWGKDIMLFVNKINKKNIN